MGSPDDLRHDPSDPGVVRSEEEAHVTIRTTPYERVRVRRRVVVEERTIEVRREELVIEREPLEDAGPEADAAAGTPALGAADELEIELRYEEVELVRRLVPFERVRVRRELVRREVLVDEQLEVERIAVERAGNP